MPVPTRRDRRLEMTRDMRLVSSSSSCSSSLTCPQSARQLFTLEAVECLRLRFQFFGGRILGRELQSQGRADSASAVSLLMNIGEDDTVMGEARPSSIWASLSILIKSSWSPSSGLSSLEMATQSYRLGGVSDILSVGRI